MTVECLLCQSVDVEETEPFLCGYCMPSTCVTCHVDSVSYVNGEFKCSHGCTYSIREYIHRKIYTEILNGGWRDKLALAGTRVEYIIQDTEAIQVHSSPPESVPEGCFIGTHYSKDSEGLIEKGAYNPELYDGASKFDGTIRDNAAYAWPYKPSYTEENLDFAHRDYVIFEVPQEKIYVSAYRFIEFVSETNRNHTIPVTKYKSELTFTPRQLYTVCSELQRPARTDELWEIDWLSI